MADQRSVKVYDAWRQASEKFDYFVVGAAGALCAYVGQHLEPERLALSPSTLELAALGVLVLSVVFGFRRLEYRNVGVLANHQALHYGELWTAKAEAIARGETAFYAASAGRVITVPEAAEMARLERETSERYEERADRAGRVAHRYYRLRNLCLLTGFLMLVAARVWRPYFG